MNIFHSIAAPQRFFCINMAIWMIYKESSAPLEHRYVTIASAAKFKAKLRFEVSETFIGPGWIFTLKMSKNLEMLKSGQMSIKKKQISLKKNYFDRIKIFILANIFLFIILVNN